jgi:hypothetical protein
MNRKITAFAFAGWWDDLGASGLTEAARNPSCRKREATASVPKPQKASRKKSRRVRVTWECLLISIHVQESVQVEYGQGELAQRLLLQKEQS